MQFIDTVAVDKASIRKTAEGYAVFNARVARAENVQLYLGDEIGHPEMHVVRVFRPADEVFRQDAMASYAGVPITVGHPKAGVTASNWKDLARGEVGDEVMRDGEFVRVPMMLRDQKAIDEVNRGTRELSAGYSAELVFSDGVSPAGEPYDAYMTDLKQNHVAIVAAARGGSELRIGDSKSHWGATPVSAQHLALVDRARGGDQLRIGDDNPPPRKLTMSDTIKTKTVMVDGLSVETTDAGAQAIAKLQQQVQDGSTALTDAATKHQTALADRDATIAKKDAEIDSLKGKVLSDEQLDQRVKARADLIATAKAVHDADYSGKTDDDIRKAAVVAKLGDAAIKDKPQAYVDARFDILVEDAKKDPVNRVLRSASVTPINDNGYQASVDALAAGPKAAATGGK